MLKRIAIAVIAAFGIAGGAQAQPAPVFNWSGFYIGGSVGYISAPTEWSYYNLPGQNIFSRPSQAIGAGHIGFLLQNNRFIYGLEGTVQAPLLTQRQCDAPIFCPNYDSYTQIKSAFTLGPRFGYSYGRWMPYVTGGLAMAEIATGFYAKGFPDVAAKHDKTHFGWFAGLGVEYMLMDNLLVGFEYQHMELAEELQKTTVVPATGVSHYVSAHSDTVRIRLTWKPRIPIQ